jgi:uncharacterized membrane protein
MQERRSSADRLAAFSDAVIAVIITIMVLELRAPEAASLVALLPLWPTAISYLVSYLFIAIIWLNHHHLLRFVGHPTPALLWVNFAHLFGISLVPFATAWVAETHLAAVPVAIYAAIFVGVNVAYLAFRAFGAEAGRPPRHPGAHPPSGATPLDRHAFDLRRRHRRGRIRTARRLCPDLLRPRSLSQARTARHPPVRGERHDRHRLS